MALRTEGYDDGWPPRWPPEVSINETHTYRSGSAVKDEEVFVILTCDLNPAYAWLASTGLTKRHAVIIHTGFDVWEDWLLARPSASRVVLVRGWETGTYASEHAEHLDALLAETGGTVAECRQIN